MPGMARNAYTEERAEVEVMTANSEKLNAIAKKIAGSLARLDDHGRNLQAALQPIYGNTSRLQITNRNIDRINEAIEKVRKPLDKGGQEGPIIKAGLQRVGIQDYLASLDRVNQALEELMRSPVRANEQVVSELRDLVRYGAQQLEAAFRDVLNEEAAPIEVAAFSAKGLAYPSISQDNSSKLRQFNSYMTSARARASGIENSLVSTTTTYAEVRGPYLARSLQNLSASSITTARRQDPTSFYTRGTCTINFYVSALEGMFTAEYDNICPIFPREQWTSLHTATCLDALKDFDRTVQELLKHVRNSMTTDCFLAYEMYDLVAGLSGRLESRNADLRKPIQDTFRPIRETAKYSFERIFKHIGESVAIAPPLEQDARPLAITTETMTRLSAMSSTAYINPVSTLLAAAGDGSWRTSGPSAPRSSSSNSKTFDVGTNGREVFSSFLTDSLDALMSSVESKSRAQLKVKSAQGVFLSNNLALVDRALQQSTDLSALVSDALRAKLDAWRKKGSNLYADGWREAAILLRDIQYTGSGSGGAGGAGRGPNRPPSGTAGAPGAVDSASFVKGMSSKDKDATKEKFKAFNATFDELVQRHKAYRMEYEVRPALAREAQALVEPLYNRFWDRYHEIDKGKGKYVKYDKNTLSATLASFG